ncbi:hypothetical protein DSM106972_089210 [Dulcicalothrix desertica PCC 7102]|uniref:Uncharacterized protein n=1 Tax=Dulcicalothrix desertica PCC 7102 TaxID=232991 RepID=A0A433UPY7_9CYAN|nr:hypothetical protein [Dulcicalothrix desertica]RUS95908.1 hypothetical protein DSM106972_089210 [Dulcicalothrix desertica PCC 7102]TWH39543.1 hypothetical protein CAL7102_08786 [Dulcicalothrix desertica PCC 7102]
MREIALALNCKTNVLKQWLDNYKGTTTRQNAALKDCEALIDAEFTRANLYDIDKNLFKIGNLDEEYTLLRVKEGEESFNSLDEFFDYVDKTSMKCYD